MVYQKTYVDGSYHQHMNHGEYCQIVSLSHHEAIVSHEMFTLAAKNIRQRGKEYGVYSAAENPENARRRSQRSPLTGKSTALPVVLRCVAHPLGATRFIPAPVILLSDYAILTVKWNSL